MMVTNDLVEISLRDGEEEVNLRRPNKSPAVITIEPASHAVANVPVQALAPAAPIVPVADAPAESSDEGLIAIDSPMVGTFYSAADPESQPFAKVGQHLSIGTVVCIVEAMKVFNEIKSEIAGTVERILVKNGQPLEYGQTMFLVRPS